MFNAGIYATLIEQFVIGVVVGGLAVATPSIVGASVPSFANWILGILAFVVAGVQVLGFIGVSREKPKLYSTYVSIHSFAITAAFSVAAVWTVMSAIQHNRARDRCIADFFDGDGDDSQGQTLCTIFPWVDVGIMGGLWVMLAIFHAYLIYVIASYGKTQRRDHYDYDRLSDPTQPLTKDTIPLEERKDAWDQRDSDGEYRDRDPREQFQHSRNISCVSASDVLNQPHQQAQYGYTGYAPYTDPHEPSYPSYAHTQVVAPTPVVGNYGNYGNYGGGESSHLSRPSTAQAHPAEGQFGRKTPRYS